LGRNIFIRGRIVVFFCSLFEILCPWGIADKRGAENLIIFKAETCFGPVPHESFFPQGQKHTISNFIREYSKWGVSHP
jgi:hypothetical protein